MMSFLRSKKSKGTDEAHGLFVSSDSAQEATATHVEEVLVVDAAEVSSSGSRQPPVKSLFSGKKTTSSAGAVEDAAEVIPVASEGADAVNVDTAQASGVRRFGFGKRTAMKSDGPVFEELPIQVIMGYLPEVSARDAMDFATGMSEKYVVQQGLAYFHVTKFERGFIYEVHEGGPGKAYAPEIAKYFASRGAYRADEPLSVVIRTAGRMVEVTRQREGLAVVLLPESSTVAPTDWLVPKARMTVAVPRRKGMLYFGLALMASGVVLAGLNGVFFRLQGYSEAPPQPIDIVTPRFLPHLQAPVLEKAFNDGARVKALRFRDGAWQPLELYGPEDVEVPGEASAPSLGVSEAATSLNMPISTTAPIGKSTP